MTGSASWPAQGLALACLVPVLLAGAAQAAPGDLDASFGEGGILSLAAADAPHSEIHDMDMHSGNRMVVAGQVFRQGDTNFHLDFAAGSFFSDGKPDPAFDGDGIVTTPVSAGDSADAANAVRRLADGRIVAAGYAVGPGGSFDFAVVRYLPDGTLDKSFSQDGIQTTDFAAQSDQARGLVVQPDGKIVLAGFAVTNEEDIPGSRFALARYTPNGSLDDSFGGGDGRVTTRFGSDAGGATHTEARALALQPNDGKLVAAGVAVRRRGRKSAFGLVRYLPNGDLDPAFSGNGVAATYLGRARHTNVSGLGIRIFDVVAEDVVVQPDGKIVAAGHGYFDGSRNDFALVRYKPNGSGDDSFSGNAKQRTEIGDDKEDNGYNVEHLGGGKLLLAGSTVTRQPDPPNSPFPDVDFGVAKYHADGELDDTFSDDGKVITPAGGGEEHGFALGVQRFVPLTRKFLVAGRIGGSNVFGGKFGFVRYLGGSPQVVVIGTPAGVYRASRLKRFTGSASADAGVRRVDIALFRGSPGLRASARRRSCRWLRSPRARFKHVRSRRGKCGRRVWLRTRGGRNWKFRLKRRLPRGRYVLYSRVTDRSGKRTRRFSARLGNRVRLRVR